MLRTRQLSGLGIVAPDPTSALAIWTPDWLERLDMAQWANFENDQRNTRRRAAIQAREDDDTAEMKEAATGLANNFKRLASENGKAVGIAAAVIIGLAVVRMTRA